MRAVKILRRVRNHKPPTHKLYLHSLAKYKTHPCWHYMTLVRDEMDMVNYGCLELLPLLDNLP